MKNAEARMRTINDLLTERFVVAEYQRGYKWTADEVCQLLDDVQNFDPARDGAFYCLQPLVISRSAPSDEWELIDGQQRVTTIYLILSFLGHATYGIRYLTRPGSEFFLEQMRQPSFASGLDSETYFEEHGDQDNIDNFHFFAAHEAIAHWFDRLTGQQGDPRAVFLNKILHQVQVIWYEADDPDHKRIFLNLNSGKIALTSAERIKALFLATRLYRGTIEEIWTKRLELSQEWDRIEYALRDEPFWLFLQDDVGWKDDGTRIDFLFGLLPGLPSGEPGSSTAYDHYAQLDRESPLDVAAEWKKLKACFLTLREWFADRELYHNVGFLIARQGSVRGLYAEAGRMSRSDFKTHVSGRIKTRLKGCQLKSLAYSEDDRAINNSITDVLLLFNLRALKNESARFAFDRYKREAWSLEHVHARKSKAQAPAEEWAQRVGWIRPQLAASADAQRLGRDLARSLEPGQAQETQEADRAELARRIDELLPEQSEKQVDRFGNLALISGDLNSALGNRPFSEKREIVIQWDKAGKFIPLATRNVFLKYYGGDIEWMNNWTLTDRASYLTEVQDILHDDLPLQS